MKKVYKFSASWCKPCKNLTAGLALKGITLPEYDIDNPDNNALMERFNIRSVPTVVVESGDSYQVYVGGSITPQLLAAIA